ncbi:Pantoate--beta-alanine ligase [Meyerozyma sp. JA9]|nr:Pantoate--beta-alanine ligase [Meyerozyma sp. JA9]
MTVSAVRVLRNVAQMRSWRMSSLLRQDRVGFVPTMGALHAGHCSLVQQSLAENDRTVVSIFVNPSQFAPHEDLDKYPRTLDTDLEMLEKLNVDGRRVDAIFVPKVSEMYPAGVPLDVEKQAGAFVTVQGCSEQLEGAQRPQFFRGVATVVTKLLNVVQPTNIYFGQKDAQQCVVVRNLVRDLLIDTNVRVLPTFREKNGLAMSSRNQYLSQKTKDESAIIYKALSDGKNYFESHKAEGRVSADSIISAVRQTLGKSGFTVEYVSLSHPETLEDLSSLEQDLGGILSTAVRVPRESGGEARLIDNVVL